MINNQSTVFLNYYHSYMEKKKGNQIVVVIDEKLDKKIIKAAKAKGLTKASWVRQLVIETLEEKK